MTLQWSMGGLGGGGSGHWVRARNEAGAKQLIEEREKDLRRRRRGTWRDVGIFALIVIALALLWGIYRLFA